MLDFITTIAASFVGAVLKKPAEQLGEAITNQVQNVRNLIDRKSPEDAKVIEGIIENPTDTNSEQALMAAVVKLSKSSSEISGAIKAPL